MASPALDPAPGRAGHIHTGRWYAFDEIDDTCFWRCSWTGDGDPTAPMRHRMWAGITLPAGTWRLRHHTASCPHRDTA